MIGETLGPYQIVAKLGAGGMGEVYRARDSRLDRHVALKLLPDELASDPERLIRFEREAKAASALNHPAIVTIYEVGTTGRQPWISMELVEGDTLRAMLASGPLPLRRTLAIVAQLADGLAKAHDAGIVHRDLKPENVMVTGDGFAKILDFGLARLNDASDVAVTRPTVGTRPGAVMGTLAYMSPEQASGAVVDFRSDQFSFGAVLYEMLTGERAFERWSSVDTLSAILRDDPRPMGELNVTIPPPVRWIVERCVEKRAADRYGSTRDLARDLANARDHLSEMSAAPVVAPDDTSRGVPTRTIWREAIPWALAVVLPLATAGVLLRRAPTDETPRIASALRFTLAAPENGVIGKGKFAVSPDGRRLALVVTEKEATRLWVRPLDSLAWQALAGTDGATDPFWSRDGVTIGFFAGDKLKRVAASGGEVRTICDSDGEGLGGAWGSDDVIVLGQQTGLHRVQAAGGTPVRLTSVAARAGDVDFWPTFLPDGRSFLFQRLGGERTGIYLAALDATEPVLLKQFSTRVTSLGFTEPNFILFVDDGTLKAQALNAERTRLADDVIRVADNVYTDPPSTSFSVSAGGLLAYWTGRQDITELTWVRRDGTPSGLPIARGAFSSFALSRNGRYLVVGRNDTTPASVWTFDLERGSSSRLTFDDYAQVPIFSPDASRVAFGSARGNPPNIYTTTVGAAHQSDRLTHSALVEFPADWSPDGQHLLFTRLDPKTGYDLWAVPMSGERVARPVLNSAFAESEAAVSPNGRWLAYTSDETGRLQVYVTTFPIPGERWPVSTAGGLSPAWSADGRELFYRDKQRIMSVAITSASRFEAAVPKVLFELQGLPPEQEQQPFRVAPDGRFLVNMVVERISPPLTVVTDWRAGLVK